jgi:hypothetical protein
MMQKVVLLFLSILVVNTTAETYSVSSTEVEVETTILDENNSTRKCVTYLSNPPEKYETACFTSTYTDGGTFQHCTVQFDNSAGKRCETFSVCTDSNKQIGFLLDCDSILPSKTNVNDQEPCTVLNDTNIQAVLTDGTTFASTPFDFTLDITNLVTDDSDKENNTKTDTKNATSGGSTIVVYGGFIATLVCVLSLYAL